jgi:hypothetical protein
MILYLYTAAPDTFICQGERIWHNTIFPRRFNGLASKIPGKQRGSQAIRAELCQPFWQPYNVQFRVQATDSKRLFSNALTLLYMQGSRKALRTKERECAQRESDEKISSPPGICVMIVM